MNGPELPEMLKVMLQAKGGNFTQEEMESTGNGKFVGGYTDISFTRIFSKDI